MKIDPDSIRRLSEEVALTPAPHYQDGEVPDPGDGRSTWAPLDLTAALEGTAEAEPVLFTTTDGRSLLYPGKLHSVHGEPESGKGWLALHGTQQRLGLGEHVVYIDFEDSAASVVGRLLALGSERSAISERFHYLRPTEPLTEHNLADLSEALDCYPSLVVIDGVTEAMVIHQLKLEDNTDVAHFLELLPRRIITHCGAAVLLIDHVTKSREQRGRYAIGGQHKLAGIDGAVYSLEVITPFAPNRHGSARVRVMKDRPGQVRQHALGPKRDQVAVLHLDSIDGRVEARLEPAREGDFAADEDVTDRYEQRLAEDSNAVLALLRETPGLSKRQVRRAARGQLSQARTDDALDALTEQGLLRREHAPGNAHAYWPASQGDDPQDTPDDELPLGDPE